MSCFGIETVPRVLCIPELLRRFFELSTDQANVAHASVCKTWSEEATRVIWHDVSAHRLFSLLAPLVARLGGEGDEYLLFAREIEYDDWDRFDRYSLKVHSLRFTRAYDPSVFKEIALGRRRLDFLPNLVALYNPQPTLLFTYSTIKHLIFTEGMFVGDELISWLRIIERRMCHIEELRIDPYYHHGPFSDVQSAFTSALKRMKSLKELEVPTGFLNDSNFHILPSIPGLQRISSVCPFWFQPPDNFSTRSLSKFPTNPFRSLQEFNVYLDFGTAMVCIPTFDGFRMLRVLKIASDAMESFENYITLLDVISLHCRRLKVLELATDRKVVEATITPVESTIIERTTKYTRRLRHLLRSLQYLESLTLQDFGVQGLVPLRDLLHFSHSRTLKVLCLDIDSRLTPGDFIPCDFPALKRLHFGPSSTSISRPTEVANFLSRILPPNCEISSDQDSDVDCATFEQVKTWVPILIKARMEGRGTVAEVVKVEESV